MLFKDLEVGMTLGGSNISAGLEFKYHYLIYIKDRVKNSVICDWHTFGGAPDEPYLYDGHREITWQEWNNSNHIFVHLGAADPASFKIFIKGLFESSGVQP
jgi:hypothetical protein